MKGDAIPMRYRTHARIHARAAHKLTKYVTYLSTFINYLDKPSPPRNITVTDVFYDNCIVHWKEPADDGGCDITSYIVESIDVTEACDTSEKSLEWNVVGETQSGEDRDFYCPNLNHGHVYKFRVRAVNRLGKSDPGLLPGPGILIKDPWGKQAYES